MRKLRNLNFKLIFQISILSAFFFMLGFAFKYHYPQFKIWALYHIRNYSAKEFGIEVRPQNLELTLFPVGVSLQKIEIRALKERKKDFPTITAQEISTTLDVFGLLSGRLRLSSLNIIDPKVTYIQRLQPPKKSAAHFELNFRMLKSIPINRLRIVNLDLNLRLNEPNISVNTSEFSAILENNDKSLKFDIVTPNLQFKNLNDGLHFELALSTLGHIQREEVYFAKFQIQSGKSQFIARGTAHGKTEELLIHDMEFDTKLHIDTKEAQEMAQQIWRNKKIPKSSGEVDLVAIVKYSGNSGYNLQFLTKSQDLKIDKYTVGSIESRGILQKDLVALDHFNISNNSGKFGLKNGKISLGEKININSSLVVHDVELQKFLATLGLDDVPTRLHFSGDLGCGGEIYPNLALGCNGEAKGKDLHVYSGAHNPKTIVKLNEFTAKGSVKVSDHDVSYDTALTVGPYQGSSRGVIDYDKGFKIAYDTPSLSFSELREFVGLKFEGLAKISGTTEGSSNAATISAKTQVSDFWLEDYLLENVESNINYGKGLLTLSDLKGRIESTSYGGQVEVNLNQKTLKISAKSSDTDLRDLQKCLSRQLHLPFEVGGFGKFQAQVNGPLDVHELDFKVLSHFNDGKVSQETFDTLISNFSADKGNIKADKILMTKNASQISLSGGISKQGTLKLLATGDQLRLEESQFLKTRLQDLRGQLDFDFSLNGPLKKPLSQFKGYLSQMSLGSEPIESSTFALNFTESSISGSGKFFGNRVSSQFDFPLTHNDPFKLYLNAKSWNFLPLVGLLVKNERQWDYKSSVTGIIDIQSPRGGFWSSSGTGQIEKMSVERGPVSMASENPVKISFDSGKITTSTLSLKGIDSYFRFNSAGSTRDSLNLSTTAKVDMTLLSLMVPVLKEIRGLLTLSLKVHGSLDQPNILGSGYVENGLVKLPDFPPSFQNIKADILFNNKKVLVNSATANLGGGEVQANGSVTLTSDKYPTIDMRGLIDRVHLNMPDGIKSVTSGSVMFSGTGFPYLITVRANVDGGEVTREFSSDDTTSAGAIKPSSLMPKAASDKDVSPIALQLALSISENFRIKNSLLNSAIGGQLQIAGDPKDPKLVGQINLIKGGKLFFRETPFEISAGQIRFKEVMADPELYIASAARVYDHDITLMVQGTGMKPQIQLTSVPNLTQPEIICLLALGLTCDDMEKRVATNQQSQQSSYQIGAALISQNPLRKQVKEKYGVDVGISSTYDSTDNSAIPQFTIGKQITPSIGAKVIRSVGRDRTDAQIFWNLNRNWSLVGVWEESEEAATTNFLNPTEKQIKNNNAVGVDLEYKAEFK